MKVELFCSGVRFQKYRTSWLLHSFPRQFSETGLESLTRNVHIKMIQQLRVVTLLVSSASLRKNEICNAMTMLLQENEVA